MCPTSTVDAMIARSLIAEASPSLIEISFEVTLIHFDFFLLVRGVVGLSTRGLVTPSNGEGLEGFTLSVEVLKPPEEQGPADEVFVVAEVCGMAAGGERVGGKCRASGEREGASKIGGSIGIGPVLGGTILCRGNKPTGGRKESSPAARGGVNDGVLDEKQGLSNMIRSGKGSSE